MIGDRIKALRNQKKVTQETLAKHLFISPQAVSRWEQGLAVPDTAILVPLADFFGVSVDYLLRDTEQSFSTDYTSAFEVKYKYTSSGVVSHFKNISTYTFERVSFKVKYFDENDEVVDYKEDWFYSSEPNTTKIVKTFNFNKPKASKVTVTITGCVLK